MPLVLVTHVIAPPWPGRPQRPFGVCVYPNTDDIDQKDYQWTSPTFTVCYG